MRPRFALAVTGVVAAAVCSYLYASPYLVIHNLRRAAEQGDLDAIGDYIDFPALRSAMKEAIRTEISHVVDERATSDDDDPVRSMRGEIAMRSIEPAVDDLTAPATVADIVSGKNLPGEDDDDSLVRRAQEIRQRARMSMGYKSLNRFQVVVDDGESASPIVFVFHRDGFSWQLRSMRYGSKTPNRGSS